jgi:hypothetical protein
MSDGRVISQVLSDPGSVLGSAKVQALGDCYKQLNSSVGVLGTDSLIASTRALESTSKGDKVYRRTEQALTQLERARDGVAGQIKTELANAEFAGARIPNANGLGNHCEAVIRQAQRLDQ